MASDADIGAIVLLIAASVLIVITMAPVASATAAQTVLSRLDFILNAPCRIWRVWHPGPAKPLVPRIASCCARPLGFQGQMGDRIECALIAFEHFLLSPDRFGTSLTGQTTEMQIEIPGKRWIPTRSLARGIAGSGQRARLDP